MMALISFGEYKFRPCKLLPDILLHLTQKEISLHYPVRSGSLHLFQIFFGINASFPLEVMMDVGVGSTDASKNSGICIAVDFYFAANRHITHKLPRQWL